MKVVYAGDETHRRARRAQGFNVGEGDDEDIEESPTPEPTESATAEPTGSPTDL